MKILLYIKAAVLIAAFFVSCDSKYSSEQLVDLTHIKDSLSVETGTDVTINYTDSAVLRARIFAPLMQRFPTAKEPYIEMSEGVKADFYDPSGEVQSSLVANYAINYELKEMIIIRDSVRVINKRDEEIKTEELIWDKKARKVYSDKPVRIRERDEKILIGEGFESNETFTKYTIKKLTGTINIKENDNKEDNEESN